jgi:hypothetical protein
MNELINLHQDRMLFEDRVDYPQWNNIQNKIDELCKTIKSTYVPTGVTVICTNQFYSMLMHKLPCNMKIRYELRRRGLKPKHIHKLNRR